MLRIKAVWLQQREERVPLVSSLVEQKGPQEAYAICGVKRLTPRFKGRKWKQRRQFSIPSSLFQRLQLVSCLAICFTLEQDSKSPEDNTKSSQSSMLTDTAAMPVSDISSAVLFILLLLQRRKNLRIFVTDFLLGCYM